MAKITRNAIPVIFQYRYRATPSTQWQSGTSTLPGNFYQVSESHPGPPYRVGGNWIMTREKWQVSPAMGSTPTYQGPLAAVTWSTSDLMLQQPPPLSASEETAHASTALANSWPTNPASNVANSLIEIRRDGLPSLPGVSTWRARTLSAKRAGNEYLNLEFGWKPLLSDVNKFLYAVRNSEKILRKYRSGANHPTKAGFAFPSESTCKVLSDIPLGILPSRSGFTGRGSVTDVATRQQWFEGTFIYHVPMGDDVVSQFARFFNEANKLFGVAITPDVLWNAAPWSWAIDWFAGVGDLITNISRNGPDGQVMQSGYFMHNSKLERTFSGVASKGSVQVPVSSVYLLEYKARKVASPYGFDLDFKGLSARQAAIIAALGVTSGGGRTTY